VHCEDLTDNEMLGASSIGVGRLVVSSEYHADLVSSVRLPGPLNIWLQSGCGFRILRGRPRLCLAGIRRASGVVVGQLGFFGVRVDSDTVYETDDVMAR
jgi:hypothetical protein